MAWHSQVHSQLLQERHHQPLPPKPLFRTTGYRYQTVPAWAIVSYRSGNKIMMGTHSYTLIFQGLNWNYECKCVHFFGDMERDHPQINFFLHLQIVNPRTKITKDNCHSPQRGHLTLVSHTLRFAPFAASGGTQDELSEEQRYK